MHSGTAARRLTRASISPALFHTLMALGGVKCMLSKRVSQTLSAGEKGLRSLSLAGAPRHSLTLCTALFVVDAWRLLADAAVSHFTPAMRRSGQCGPRCSLTRRCCALPGEAPMRSDALPFPSASALSLSQTHRFFYVNFSFSAARSGARTARGFWTSVIGSP